MFGLLEIADEVRVYSLVLFSVPQRSISHHWKEYTVPSVSMEAPKLSEPHWCDMLRAKVYRAKFHVCVCMSDGDTVV